MVNLKTEVDKLDIKKLVPVPTDLSKLNILVKNDVVKETVYDKLVAKVNNIDTNNFVLETKYDTDKSELENEITGTSGLVKKTDYFTKITEIEDKIPNISNLTTKTALTTVENKIPSVSNLATKTALTTVENKIPDVTNLVKETDYDTKVTEIEMKISSHNNDKYIDFQEFNKLAADIFNATIAQVTKTDFDAKLSSLNRIITANQTKHLFVENELNNLKTFDSSYIIGKSHFEEDGTQNHLVSQPIYKYFKVFSIT